jgi:hypothetical protein
MSLKLSFFLIALPGDPNVDREIDDVAGATVGGRFIRTGFFIGVDIDATGVKGLNSALFA